MTWPGGPGLSGRGVAGLETPARGVDGRAAPEEAREDRQGAEIASILIQAGQGGLLQLERSALLPRTQLRLASAPAHRRRRRRVGAAPWPAAAPDPQQPTGRQRCLRSRWAACHNACGLRPVSPCGHSRLTAALLPSRRGIGMCWCCIHAGGARHARVAPGAGPDR